MLRHTLIATALLLGLAAGCSSNRPASEAKPAESGGTPSPSTETPPPPPATKPAEDTSGGTAAADSKPTLYYVKDSGIRCIAPPCPQYIATRADRPDEDGIQITSVDLAATGFAQEQTDRFIEATHTAPGVKVEAIIKTVPKAGPAGDAKVLTIAASSTASSPPGGKAREPEHLRAPGCWPP